MPVSVIVLLVVLAVSAVGSVWVVRRERRRPSSYSRRPDVLAGWRALPSEVQAAHDEAALDAAEAAERVASAPLPRSRVGR
ncbi:hypothetical protein KVH31_34440 [Streptomyces olivaceus]|uniref:hypothetical protein n=1 Tax=Streptomyces olivaceus TaxID=47716 RepID=UPI001CCC4CA3|nr:hypothetical protein [Streptomyces olivaceus]MBZ6211596.1 hypothetical protein [Streptomyces olivaceus]